jgi:hypothetical protein
MKSHRQLYYRINTLVCDGMKKFERSDKYFGERHPPITYNKYLIKLTNLE